MIAVTVQPPQLTSVAAMDKLGYIPCVWSQWKEPVEDFALFADLPSDGGMREWCLFLRLMTSPRCQAVYRTGPASGSFATLEYLLWESGFPICNLSDTAVWRSEKLSAISPTRREPILCATKQPRVRRALAPAHDLVENEIERYSPHDLRILIADTSSWKLAFSLMPLVRIAIVDSPDDPIPSADGYLLLSPQSVHRLPETAQSLLVCPPFLPLLEDLHFGPPISDRSSYALVLDRHLLKRETYDRLRTDLQEEFSVFDACDLPEDARFWWRYRSVCLPANQDIHPFQWIEQARGIAASGTPLITLNLPHLSYLPFAVGAATFVPDEFLTTSIITLVEEFDRNLTDSEECKLLLNAWHTNMTVLLTHFLRRLMEGAA